MSLDNKIARRISLLRKAQGLTLEKLAFYSGIGKGTLSQIERGRASVKAVTLEKIVKEGLNMSLVEFFDSDIFLEDT